MMIFHWSLCGRKSPHVSMTLLNILADLNNTVVWMVSTPLISKSSISCINPFVTELSAPVTIGITVTFIFHSFFSILWQGLGTYYSFPFPSVLPCGQPEPQSPLFIKFSFLFLLSLCLDVWPRLDDPRSDDHSMRVFHTCWLCPEVWLIASRLRSPWIYWWF